MSEESRIDSDDNDVWYPVIDKGRSFRRAKTFSQELSMSIPQSGLSENKVTQEEFNMESVATDEKSTSLDNIQCDKKVG